MGANDYRYRTEVLIVGGGPVGMLLALFLDRYGVKSVVFNTDDGVPTHPRGSTHNSRTMEHYRRLGISGTIRKLGLPPDHPKDAAYFTRLSGWEIARYRMPSEIELARLSAATQITDQIPEPMQRADQIRVADFLVKHLRKRSNVELRFGWQADHFSQDANGVGLTARRVADGQSERWRARYLVGCDGGQSDVRRSLGIRYSGYDRLEQAYLGGRMTSTYLRAPTLYRDYLGRRRAWMYWVVNPELRSTLFTLNGKDEFMFYTKPKDSDAPPDDAAVRDALFRSIGSEAPVEFIGHQPWTAGAALVAERFADRRILLAGDAVHLFTPTGGFGMNTGVDDVANLSWKLAATLQGWGGKSLLILTRASASRSPCAIRGPRARSPSKSAPSISQRAWKKIHQQEQSSDRKSVPKCPLIWEHNLLQSASNSEPATTALPLLLQPKQRRRIASCNIYRLASLEGALPTAGSGPGGASAILFTIISAMASRYCASDRSHRTAPVWRKPRRNPACHSIFSM